MSNRPEHQHDAPLAWVVGKLAGERKLAEFVRNNRKRRWNRNTKVEQTTVTDNSLDAGGGKETK